LSGVTAENYIIRADKFENATGKAIEFARAADACFMITSGMHKQQAAWRRYFHTKGMSQRVSEMKRWLESRGQYAVPAEWPWNFDQSVDSDR